jgi:hypothetical protein
METNQRQIEEALAMLEEIDKSDAEMAHIDADAAILYYLKVSGARKLAEAYEDLKLEVGFHFA